MKKVIFGLFAIMSIFSYSQEINLWEESSPSIEMGYTGFEAGGNYKNRSVKNQKEIQRFVDDIYSIKGTINENLKNNAMTANYEKDWVLKGDINYLKDEDLKTPMYSINYGIVNDTTRYGLAVTFLNGESKAGIREYDVDGGQLNLYFNKNEDLGNLFGTAYIGKINQDFNENAGEIDNLYYGYFTNLEQKYESFNFDEFYSGYFVNFDISRIDTDYKLVSNGKELKTSKDNDSINAELGFLLEKNLFFYNDTSTKIKFLSSIGKEFLEEDKYKELGKDDFEMFAKEKLEISTTVGTVLDVFAGLEYRKSLKNSCSDKNLYLGFKVSF